MKREKTMETFLETFFKTTGCSVLCLLMAFLGGCSSSSTPTPTLNVSSVSIYAQPGANNNSATAVDVVLVYNTDLVTTLSQMPSSTYFAQSQQLVIDNPTLLDIWHWELVPGQVVQNFELDQSKGAAFAGFVFANYQSPGSHRLTIGPDGAVDILLQDTNLISLAISNYRDMKQGTTMSDLPTSQPTSFTTEATSAGSSTKKTTTVKSVPVAPCSKVAPSSGGTRPPPPPAPPTTPCGTPAATPAAAAPPPSPPPGSNSNQAKDCS